MWRRGLRGLVRVEGWFALLSAAVSKGNMNKNQGQHPSLTDPHTGKKFHARSENLLSSPVFRTTVVSLYSLEPPTVVLWGGRALLGQEAVFRSVTVLVAKQGRGSALLTAWVSVPGCARAG